MYRDIVQANMSVVYLPVPDWEFCKTAFGKLMKMPTSLWFTLTGEMSTQEARARSRKHLSYLMTDMGADVIIGHHPHVIEPVTRVQVEGDPNNPQDNGNTAIVMNSLGNFVFDQGWTRTRDSTMAQMDFLTDGGAELSFVPMQISDTRPRETNGLLKPLRDFRIFRTLRKELDNEYWHMEDDRLVIDLKKAGVIEG